MGRHEGEKDTHKFYPALMPSLLCNAIAVKDFIPLLNYAHNRYICYVCTSLIVVVETDNVYPIDQCVIFYPRDENA